MCTSGSCRCNRPQPGTKLRDTKLLQVKQKIIQTFQKYQPFYLEFRLSSASDWVAQEGDERGPGCVFVIVVLRAVTVNQLDQAVVVRQTRVGFTQTPGSEGGGEKSCQKENTLHPVGLVDFNLTALWLTSQ